jgi:hypothetical protein
MKVDIFILKEGAEAINQLLPDPPDPEFIYISPAPLDEEEIELSLPRRQNELVDILWANAEDIYEFLWQQSGSITGINWWLCSTLIGDKHAVDHVRNGDFTILRKALRLQSV